MSTPFLRTLAAIIVIFAVAMVSGPSTVQGQADPVVARGVQFLKGQTGGQNGLGETALAALALVKAEVPASDPAIIRAVAAIEKRFSSGGFTPERAGGADIYEASVIILALSNLDAVSYKSQIDLVARFLTSRQNANGSWDYTHRSAGDTSISQYAVLGLWEAENAGVSVSAEVWDHAAQFFLSSQSAAGGWTYHRDEGGQDTVSMTAAGVGSLLICERQLAPYRLIVKNANPLLIPVDPDAEWKKYLPDVSPKRITQAIQAGASWIGSNFATNNTVVMGHSPYYALYGIERIGALADQATIGRRDWFLEGQRFLAATQSPGGNFTATYGDTPNTAWAVLFLTKATAKSIKKITLRRLGAGTLIGGRGLPRDLSQISVAGGRVIARPMDGAIEGMLAVLEDPRVDDANSALAGLFARYRTEGPKVLKPFQDRFRKLLTDPDQGVRRVAAWALARTGDLTMALPLIEALRDPDPGVVAEARQGLQLLARKIDGFGPEPSASPEQREKAILQWKTWYETVRPLATTEAEPSSEPASKTSTSGRRSP